MRTIPTAAAAARRRALPLAALLLTGAAQSDGFSVTDATSEQVDQAYWSHKPGGPMHMGQWERSYEVTGLELPGMAPGPERDARIAQAQQPAKTESVCHSGGDYAAPEPKAVFEVLGENCHYQRLTMGGGTFEGSMTCDGFGGGKLTNAVSGSYDPDRFTIRMQVDAQGASPEERVKLTMSVAGRRTGECKPAQ